MKQAGQGVQRVLFVVTEDWYFVSHRLALALALRAAGYEVAVATRTRTAAAAVRAAGIALYDVPFERSLRRPWRDLASLLKLRRLLDATRPDLVHLVSLKPILVGATAMLLTRRRPAAVWAITGMGYLVSSDAWLARLLRPLVLRLLGLLFRDARSRVIVQNGDDAEFVARLGIDGAAVRVVPGAGIDTDHYRPLAALPLDPPVVLLPARLLRDKGVYEFAAAAREVRALRDDVRFVLAGTLDADQHGAIDRRDLERWQREGVVEWWGHCEDMVATCNRATIVCLPSYREGMSKALLEGGACARPLLAADVPGCREICIDGVNGRLVPPRDAAALAAAIIAMLSDSARLQGMGAASRAHVIEHFDLARVSAATARVYSELLDDPEPASV